MPLLVVDIGNTHIVMGVFRDDVLVGHWRLVTDRDKTEDEYGVFISQLLEGSGLSVSQVKDIVISSVVPPLTLTFRWLSEKYFKKSPLIVGPGVRTGITVRVDNPREVGADRIVNAVGAHEKYKTGCIIVDFGTATTFDLVSSRGEYLGGAIAPGIAISSEALFKMASKLPRIEIEKPSTVVGKNTVDSMKAGIFFGYVSLVDGIVERMKREADEEVLVVATGGHASIIAPESETIDLVDENLTLEGLRIIYFKNKTTREEGNPGDEES
ncbi:MAG: type III pantothenate kinase [Deltaproteobacteria bacterium]|nr:MAG: type III pantothenate kinase [Deltaproteobacteria bacterium]